MFLPKHTPLESVAEAQRRAKKRLPHSVYVAVLAGSEKGITMDQNVAAFDQIGFRPRVGVGFPPVREMSTTVLGQEISLPVIISPAGVQAIAPGGEVPVARAAAQVGTAIGQSNFASMPFEAVAAANPKAFFQVYWTATRDEIAPSADTDRQTLRQASAGSAAPPPVRANRSNPRATRTPVNTESSCTIPPGEIAQWDEGTSLRSWRPPSPARGGGARVGGGR